MFLYYDEYDDIYVWIDTQDHNIEYSPWFDTEAQANEWYERISKIIFEKFGITHFRSEG